MWEKEVATARLTLSVQSLNAQVFGNDLERLLCVEVGLCTAHYHYAWPHVQVFSPDALDSHHPH